MVEYHPDRDALECFARGEVLAETERWILEHLRSNCAICQRTVDALLPRLSELPAATVTSGATASPSTQLGRPLAAVPSPAKIGTPLPLFDPSRRAALACGPATGPAGLPGHHAERPGTAPWLPRPMVGPRLDLAGNVQDRRGLANAAAAPAGADAGAPRAGAMPETTGTAGTIGTAGIAGTIGTAGIAETAGTIRAPETPETPETTEVNEIAAFDRIFAKLEQRLAMIDSERAAAPRLLGELLQRPAAERGALVHASRRFQTLALCDLLLDRSCDAGSCDSVAAADFAGLGIAVADHLDVRYYGSAVVHDMMARAWAYLGNARRLGADLAGAEQALAFAESLAEDGSADPLEEARLLDLKASLLCDQGWFEEAADLLETVIEIYDDIKDLHRKGCAVIRRGIYLGGSGRPQQAVELIPQGLALLEREIEPPLEMAARHELAWSLNECGQCEQAQHQLESCRQSLQAGGGDAWIELRLEWLEGRIANRAGRRLEAEQRLGSLLQRCVTGGLGYEAALVMLDLANIYLEQGKRSEIRGLAEGTLPFFLSLDIHRQAVAALVAFHQAAADDLVTPSLVRDIAAYLQRARKNPRLSFQVAA